MQYPHLCRQVFLSGKRNEGHARIANAIACGIVTIPIVTPAFMSSAKEYLFGKLKIDLIIKYKLQIGLLNDLIFEF